MRLAHDLALPRWDAHGIGHSAAVRKCRACPCGPAGGIGRTWIPRNTNPPGLPPGARVVRGCSFGRGAGPFGPGLPPEPGLPPIGPPVLAGMVGVLALFIYLFN